MFSLPRLLSASGIIFPRDGNILQKSRLNHYGPRFDPWPDPDGARNRAFTDPFPEPDPVYRRGNTVNNGYPGWPGPQWGHGVFNGGGNWPRPPWVFGSNSRARSDPEPEPDPIYRRQISLEGFSWTDGIPIKIVH